MTGISDGDPDFQVKLERRRKLSAEDIADMCTRYIAGDTMQALADRYGVTISAVHYQLSKRIVTRPQGSRPPKAAAQDGG